MVRMPAGVGELIQRQGRLQLGLLDRAGAQPRRPPALVAARQGPGRLVLDQRHDLHPRPRPRLRPVAPDGPDRLGLCRRAALLQARRELRGRRRRLARRRGAAARLQGRHRPTRSTRAFVEAGGQAGYKRTNDFNGFQQEGFGPYQLTIHDGKRWSASAAYLQPILGKRANLTARDRRAHHPHPDRERPRRRRRVRAGRPRRAPPTPTPRCCSAPARCSRRTSCSSPGIGDPERLKAAGVAAGARAEGRRREPAGPPRRHPVVGDARA